MPLLLTLAVCLTWVLLAIAFCGIGVLWLHRLTRFQPSWENAYLAVWAGFALVMAALLLWHFLLPVNWLALWTLVVVSAVSIALERRWFLAAFATTLDSWFVFSLAAFTLWAANHALAQGGMDDYNYEFQSIRWFHDYRIVPGLANLHGRIGFNDSHHLLGALLSSTPWAGAVNHIFNGFFVVLAFVLLASAVRNLFLGRKFAWVFPATLLISPTIGLVLFGIFGPMISTLKADVFMCATIAVLAVLFIEFAHIPASDSRWLALGNTLVPLAVVLVSVKLTAVAFCGVIAVAVFLRLGMAGWNSRSLQLSVLVSTLILGSVLVRGVILSGYPLYPTTLLGAPVDWRVPVAEANAEMAYIKSWAELRPTYDGPVEGWTWLPTWAQSTILTDKFNIVLPVILALMCLPFLLFPSRDAGRASGTAWCFAILAVACILALVLWFIEAPAGRFASIYFWILFAIALALVANRGTRLGTSVIVASTAVLLALSGYVLFSIVGVPRPFRSGMLLMLAFSFFWINAVLWSFKHRDLQTRGLAVLCVILGLFQIGDRVLAHLLQRRFAQVAPMVWLPVPTLPERLEKDRYIARQTPKGLTVYVAHDARYETPLPNTRFWNPALELRVPGDLSRGFRTSIPPSAARYGYSVRVVVTPGEDKEIITLDGQAEENSRGSR